MGKVELDKKKRLEKILKKQEREITALRATLGTKSSISTSAKPIPSEREQSVDGRSRGLAARGAATSDRTTKLRQRRRRRRISVPLLLRWSSPARGGWLWSITLQKKKQNHPW